MIPMSVSLDAAAWAKGAVASLGHVAQLARPTLLKCGPRCGGGAAGPIGDRARFTIANSKITEIEVIGELTPACVDC
jgi:hypothetical protein